MMMGMNEFKKWNIRDILAIISIYLEVRMSMLSNFINMDPEPFKSCLEQEIGKLSLYV